MKINLGAGKQQFPDYLTVDLYDDADLCFDISSPWPIGDERVEEIISFHVFEHISFRSEQLMWSELYRVLQPGGRIHIEVPDTAAIMKLFLDESPFSFASWVINGTEESWGEPMRFIYGYQSGPGQYHLSGYTKQKLEAIAEGFGFTQHQVTTRQTGNMPCLVLEAVK